MYAIFIQMLCHCYQVHTNLSVSWSLFRGVRAYFIERVGGNESCFKIGWFTFAALGLVEILIDSDTNFLSL